MARVKSTSVQNNFIRGLITESTALSFPEDACTETFNCEFDEKGVVTRRKGFEFESNYTTPTIVKNSAETYTSFLWSVIAGQSENTFLVQQTYNILRFFDVSDSLEIGTNQKSFTVDLDTLRPTGSNFNAGEYECSYSESSGDLIVVNPVCNPFYIEYDEVLDNISTTTISIKVRDFDGTETDHDNRFRPSASYDEYIISDPDFIYNLVNKGWSLEYLSTWDDSRSDLPSYSDFVGFYGAEKPFVFDVSKVPQVPEVTVASNGHFILDAFAPDRSAVLYTDGIPNVVIDEEVVLESDGTIIGDFPTTTVTRMEGLYDGNTSLDSSSCTIFAGGSIAWFGKNLSPTKSVSSVIVYPSSDLGYLGTDGTFNIKLYAKNGASPTSPTDGTLLGTGSTEDDTTPSASYTVTSSDTTTLFDYIWVVAERIDSGATDFYFSSLDIIGRTAQLFDRTAGVNIGVGVQQGVLSYSFDGQSWEDGLVNETVQTGGTAIGKDLLIGYAVDSISIYSGSSGFTNNKGISLRLYGSNTFPTHSSDGAALSASTGGGASTANTVFLESTDKVSTYRYLWVYLLNSGNNLGTMYNYTSELEIYINAITSLDMTTGPSIGATGTSVSNHDDLAFDGYISVLSGDCAVKTGTKPYLGKTFTVDKRVSRIDISSPSDIGLILSASNIQIDIYGSSTSPSSATDGTYLGSSGSINDFAGTISIKSNDTTSSWKYLWSTFRRIDDVSEAFYVAEMKIYQIKPSGSAINVDPANIFFRPSQTTMFSNRICYGGSGTGTISSNIYISKVLESNKEIGVCHQVNDPTSTYNATVLSTDGLVVRIPEMVRLKKLVTINGDLLIIASNGVWVISGPRGQPFTPTNFRINKISGVRCDSTMSVVDVEGTPVWWGEDGIFTINYNVQFDAYSVVSLSDESIEGFLEDIPEINKRYVKGAYDFREKRVYWLYRNDASLTRTDFYRYNRVLILNTKSKAFYPWVISSSEPEVRDINFIMQGDRLNRSDMRYTTTINTGSGVEQELTFSHPTSTTYLDWSDDVEYEEDYTSYFVTGYMIHGEAQRFIQPNWLFLLLEQETNASAKVQAIFDYANSGNSGKYSSVQEAYNSSLTNRDVIFRRLKIRGKGRSMQWQVTSSTGQPFSIIGWSTRESGNADV